MAAGSVAVFSGCGGVASRSRAVLQWPALPGHRGARGRGPAMGRGKTLSGGLRPLALRAPAGAPRGGPLPVAARGLTANR